MPEVRCTRPSEGHALQNGDRQEIPLQFLGIFCLVAPWIGSVVTLILFLIQSFKEVSTLGEGGLAAMSALVHAGLCYALWMALSYANGSER